MSNVAKTTILLMVATMIAKVLGFIRELVLASSYGASMYSDAYITAMNIPLIIFTVIGSMLGTVLIPIYFEVNNECGSKEALKFVNNMTNIVALICVLLAGIGILFADDIVKLFAIGFRGEILETTIQFTKIIIIGIIFSGLSYMMTAYLQIKNNFIIPGLITIPKNIVVILAIVISANFNPYIMIWGTLIGSIIEFLVQVPFAINKGYKYKAYISIKDKYIKKASHLILPVMIGVAVNQMNVMIDRTLASTLVEGSISALNYANRLNGFVMGLFITSIATVIYPKLSKFSLEKNKEQFTRSISTSINVIILLIIPISVGAIVLSKPIVELLFKRGEFGVRAVEMTSIALIMYSIGMLGVGLRDILNKIFYSLKDTKTPMINGIITMLMNIALNLILIRSFKIAGLALATSISALLCTILMFRSLKNKVGYFGQDKIIKTTFKSIIASIIMGVVTHYIYNIMNISLGGVIFSKAIRLSGSIGIGAISYITLISVLKVEELDVIKQLMKNKLEGRKNKAIKS